MKPLKVDVCRLVSACGAFRLMHEDRCRVFDALPRLVLIGEAGWTTEDYWRMALGYSIGEWPEWRNMYAQVLQHDEGWGLRPVAEAAEEQKSISSKRAEAGRKGGRGKQTKANRKQKKANDKQMLSVASSDCGAEDSAGGVYGREDGFTSSIDSRVFASNQNLTAYSLPCADGETWVATAEQVASWRAGYPSLDLRVEFSRMASWLLANPSRGKTSRGMARFANSWLARATAPQPERREVVTPSEAASVWGLAPRRGGEVPRG